MGKITRQVMMIGGAVTMPRVWCTLRSLRTSTGTPAGCVELLVRSGVKIAGKDAAQGFMFLSPPVPGDLDTAVQRRPPKSGIMNE